jgi:hypothetical protein
LLPYSLLRDFIEYLRTRKQLPVDGVTQSVEIALGAIAGQQISQLERWPFKTHIHCCAICISCKVLRSSRLLARERERRFGNLGEMQNWKEGCNGSGGSKLLGIGTRVFERHGMHDPMGIERKECPDRAVVVNLM